MRIALVSDTYPPQRISGAVHMRDLAHQLTNEGHDVTVIVACPNLDQPFRLEAGEGPSVLRLKTPKTKDTAYIQRALAEFTMPYAMIAHMKRSPVEKEKFDGVVWYSPSIFFGPLIKHLAARNKCRTYLILRDIFPDWMVELGLLKKGIQYQILKHIEFYQYSIADVIGVQSAANFDYFKSTPYKQGSRLEVLETWAATAPDLGCSIDISKTPLAGRKIFVFAGNMGVAQGLQRVLEMFKALKHRDDIGLALVGRGSELSRLKSQADSNQLDNVCFFDEISPEEIAGLYAQCRVGIVALDPRLRVSNNLPGKFVSYMQAGLPVLAFVNPGNNLAGLIERERIGRVSTALSADGFAEVAEQVLNDIATDTSMPARCRSLSARMFDVEVATRQIVSGLQQ